MTTTTRQPEIDLLRPVVAWFRSIGLHVDEEVSFQGRRIDAVVSSPSAILAISGKVRLNDDVIEQADELRGVADGSYVAFSCGRIPADEDAAWDRLADAESLGIGVIHVIGEAGFKIVRHKPYPSAQPHILRAVLPRHVAVAEAGSRTVRHSPESILDAAIRRALAYGERTVRELADTTDALRTYGTPTKAVNAIKRRARAGLIDGVEAFEEAGITSLVLCPRGRGGLGAKGEPSGVGAGGAS